MPLTRIYKIYIQFLFLFLFIFSYYTICVLRLTALYNSYSTLCLSFSRSAHSFRLSPDSTGCRHLSLRDKTRLYTLSSLLLLLLPLVSFASFLLISINASAHTSANAPSNALYSHRAHTLASPLGGYYIMSAVSRPAQHARGQQSLFSQ